MFRSKGLSQEECRREELKQELEKMSEKMDIVYSNLSYAIDPDLIDCYIYELNAIQKKYKFLLKQVKEECTSAEI